MTSALITLASFLVLGLAVFLFLRFTVLGRGLSVPLRNMVRPVETASYPETPRPLSPGFHGLHQLNRYADGLEKCIGCELCAWACPADAIYVQGADNTAAARYSPGERYAEDYQINYNRCILCGLCVEACPTRALTMTQNFEFSAPTREQLIWTKGELVEAVPDGGQDTPQPDREVQTRGLNYYGGLAVTPPNLHGGTYQPAANAPSARAGSVLPTGDLPSTAQEPADPATVDGATQTTDARGKR